MNAATYDVKLFQIYQNRLSRDKILLSSLLKSILLIVLQCATLFAFAISDGLETGLPYRSDVFDFENQGVTIDQQDESDYFITTWETTTSQESITIPTTGPGYKYTVDWGDGLVDTGITGNVTHTYEKLGSHRIMISGSFPRIFFNNSGDKDKILTIDQWGAIQWTSMERAFYGCSRITLKSSDNPDLRQVTSMEEMFWNASAFNGDVSGWDVSNVTDMSYMFQEATSFNQPLDNWAEKVGNVTDMSGMFQEASSFNQPLNRWDVSQVIDMKDMFWLAAAFNQNINGWDVSNVTDMVGMFQEATSFNQNLSAWVLNPDVDLSKLFDNSGMSCANYSATLIGWSAHNQSVIDVTLGAKGMQYGTNAIAAHNFLTNQLNWTINEDTPSDGVCTRPFITTWKTTTDGESITIPTGGTQFNYNVKWGDGTEDTGVTGSATHAYDTPGTYVVEIAGDFPHIYFTDFGYQGNASKILTVEQWGDIEWGSMSYAFRGCFNLSVTANDVPDLSNVTSMAYMFNGCRYISGLNDWDVSNVTNMEGLFAQTLFNEDLSNWDVSNVTNTGAMFYGTLFNQDISGWDVGNVVFMNNMFFQSKFNRDINGWDVSNVTGMAGMFSNSSFNQNISGWDVSNVTSMSSMFYSTQFNQDISGWDVSSVTDMSSMFYGTPFNQDISDWDVSSVTNMTRMFFDASNFDQFLGDWRLKSGLYMSDTFTNSGMSCGSYSETLIGWQENNLLTTNVTLIAEGLSYGTNAAEARNQLLSQSWRITGDIPSPEECFVSERARVSFNTTTEIKPTEPMEVYPNPTPGQLNIRFGSEVESVNQLVIYSISGQALRKEKVAADYLDNRTTPFSIDVSGLKRGIYLIELQGSGFAYKTRFFKQ